MATQPVSPPPPTTRPRSHSSPEKGATVSRDKIPASGLSATSLSVKPNSTLSTPSPSTSSLHQSTNSMSLMTQKDHPYSITFRSRVRYDNKDYSCTMILPTLKPHEKLTEQEHKDLESAAEELKGLFLKDLEQKAKAKIHGGDDFKVLFTDNGYTAYIPSTDQSLSFDPTKQSLEDAKTQKYFKDYVSSEDEIGQALSSAISSGEADKIKQYLKAPQLDKLRDQKNTEPSASKNPVGLVRDQQQCYFNSAFLHWATNPLIKNELLANPKYLKDGTKNPLYTALKEYQESRQNGKPYRLNDSLIKSFGFNPNVQNDMDHVLKSFASQLDYSQIPDNSPLHSETIHTSFCQDHHDEEPIQSDRVEEPCLASRTIEIKENQTIEKLLTAENTETDGTRLNSLAGKPVVARIQTFTSAPDVLFVCAKRKSNEPVKAELSMNFSKAHYDLQGFSVHKGSTSNSGHFVTYVREGDQYFFIDDDKVQSITSETFLKEASTGCEWVFNKKGVVPASVDVAKSENNHPIDNERVVMEGGGYLDVESGRLSRVGQEFILVNPTDQFVTVAGHEIGSLNARTTKAKQEAVKKNWFNKTTYTLGDGEILKIPAEDSEHEVFHINISKSNEETIKKAVKTVLEEAQKKGKTSVALPLFAKENEKNVLKWMKEAVCDFTRKNKSHISPIQAVKIILTPEQAEKLSSPPDRSKRAQKPSQQVIIPIGSHHLIIQKYPQTSKRRENPDLDTSLQKEEPIDLRSSQDPQKAITDLASKLSTIKKDVTLLIPENTDIKDLISGADRLNRRFEAKPIRKDGTIIFSERYPNIELIVETAEDDSSAPSRQLDLDTYYTNLFMREDKPNAEYVFDLRDNASDLTSKEDIVSMSVETNDPIQSFKDLLGKLQANPPLSKRKIRVVLPENTNPQGIQALLQGDALSKINEAIPTEAPPTTTASKNSIVLPPLPEKPGLFERFVNFFGWLVPG